VGGNLYGRRWRAVRELFLAKNPVCAKCSGITAATEVDHVIPHRGDQAIFWSEANWMALCKACHSRKTAKEVGFHG
jgi:5-methylcytosine-specific restriction protein A